MKSNKEYFEKYFAICELLVEKRLMGTKLWEGDSKGQLPAQHYQSRKDMATVNALVLDEEKRLHEEVTVARANGTIFAFETFARKRMLTAFERRLVLYFLHLDLFLTGEVAIERRELAELLDCEVTPASRGKVLLDLFPGSRLFKKKIITEIEGRSQVRLAVPVRDMLRNIVCGRKARLSRQNEDHDNEDLSIGKLCPPEYKLEEVALSPEKKQEVLLHVDTHEQMCKLGTMKGLKRGKGLGMLFFGPPGTGKSMLAHGLAAHVGKKVLQVSVSQVRSKWVGESEKNIVRIFKLAKEKGAVICLDEVDSLIFTRERATRGFEMSQANVFLEEVEKFDGIFIMTTNMEMRLDPALERRVALRVRFDVPSAAVRQDIWRKHIPSSVKCSDDIDWAHLGE
ncbi:MAG: AAA family ATPase, partial [Candidatus Omnitrophica bacterium]|nr:AAA family ATPase [Candidatus Omnitrophota bacterium]